MIQKIMLVAGIVFGLPALAIDNFTPLTGSASLLNTNEATNPFLLPAGWTQQKIVDVNTLNGPDYFDGAFPARFRFWDMIAIDNLNSNLLFTTHEFPFGSGLTRINRGNDTATILLQGNETFSFSTNPTTWSHLNDDFGTLDPAVYTPWGSLLTAEEGSGKGRLFELTNPATATGVADAQWNWRNNIPSVAHEGLKFDNDGNMFFVDEDISGSIYKFAPTTAGDLSVGQTFVLDVASFAGDASASPNAAINLAQARVGAAAWVAITDENGNALTTADPFDFDSRGGRAAADEVEGTPYSRPEDLEVKVLANGNLALLFAASDEHIVYSVELDMNGIDATVREFVSAQSTPDLIGNDPVGMGNNATYGFRLPDNLAIDPDGDIFILEDDNPGDIWVAKDTDNDGVADYMSLFASLAVPGSEPSGLIYDPQGGFLINVDHPTSGNDALWRITPIPVPAAVWLFGSALAGLSLQRRRRVSRY